MIWIVTVVAVLVVAVAIYTEYGLQPINWSCSTTGSAPRPSPSSSATARPWPAVADGL
jgi:hypothetical protein